MLFIIHCQIETFEQNFRLELKKNYLFTFKMQTDHCFSIYCKHCKQIMVISIHIFIYVLSMFKSTALQIVGLLERLRNGQKILVAEGYLFELEQRGYLKAGAFVPEVVIENPEVVRMLHEEFVHAGSDVVEAFTVSCNWRAP